MSNKIRLTISLDPISKRIINRLAKNHNISMSKVVNIALKTLGTTNYIKRINNATHLQSLYIVSNNRLHDDLNNIRIQTDRISENINQMAFVMNYAKKNKTLKNLIDPVGLKNLNQWLSDLTNNSKRIESKFTKVVSNASR